MENTRPSALIKKPQQIEKTMMYIRKKINRYQITSIHKLQLHSSFYFFFIKWGCDKKKDPEIRQ